MGIALVRVLIAAVSLLGFLANSASAATIGSAALVVNDVTGALGQGQPTTVLIAGVDVMPNEVVATGKDSASKVVFQDKTELEVGPLSEVTLDRFVFDPDPSKAAMVLSVVKGAARFTTGVLTKTAYQINTPSAVVAVRGTVLNIDIDRSHGTSVWVEEGRALVTAGGRTVTVNGGQSTFARIGGTPSRPTTGGPSRSNSQMRNLLRQASTGHGTGKTGQGSRRAGDAKSTIAAILARFPDGGQALSDAIAEAVEADPSLTNAVVAAALTADSAQQQSIGGGLAQAAVFEANSGTAAGQAVQEQIQAAIASAPAATLAAFDAGGGTAALLATVTSVTTNLTTSNCVSPSKPGGGC